MANGKCKNTFNLFKMSHVCLIKFNNLILKQFLTIESFSWTFWSIIFFSSKFYTISNTYPMLCFLKKKEIEKLHNEKFWKFHRKSKTNKLIIYEILFSTSIHIWNMYLWLKTKELNEMVTTFWCWVPTLCVCVWKTLFIIIFFKPK